MEKKRNVPRICEVLGVEPGEWFWVRSGDRKFRVTPVSGRVVDSKYQAIPMDLLIRIINFPEDIIRENKFSEDEVTSALALAAFFPLQDVVFSRNFDERCTLLCNKEGKPTYIDLGTIDAFPSCRPGMSVSIETIIREGERNGYAHD